MKILLLNLPRVGRFPVVREERFEHKDFEMVQPPLSLLYSASMLRTSGYEVELIDANGYEMSVSDVVSEVSKIDPSYIITRIAFDTQKNDLDAIRIIKENIPKSKIIIRNKIISDVGGLKEELLKNNRFVDYFVDQELESVIHTVIDDLENGRIPRNVSYIRDNKIFISDKTDLIEDLDKFPFPAYDLLPDIKCYHTSLFGSVYTLVLSSRGCPYGCNFCAYSGTKYRERSPENVIEELKYLKENFNLSNFVFFDDTISLNLTRAKKIFALMAEEKLNLKFGICTRVDKVDEEMLCLGKEAGCVEVGYGVESGSQKILELCGKGIKKEQIVRAVSLAKKYKFKVVLSVILGLPGENKKTVSETFKFVKKLNPYYCQYATAVPFPNTKLYSYLSNNGLLISKDWERYNPLETKPVFRTEQLSESELENYKRKGYLKFILRPAFILSKISLRDMLWNFKGLKMFLNRVAGLLSKNHYIR